MLNNNDDLYKIRHSLAHILAQAVKKIRPDAKLGFGPPIDSGFYYDFYLKEPLTEAELGKIEELMKDIIKEDQQFSNKKLPVKEALQLLKEKGEELKIEYCKELAETGEKEIGFYINGPFVDMCKGPHVHSTGEIPIDCFKLDSIAGAYWRGDEKKPQLTRVYGLAFNNKKELEEFIKLRKLAKDRDHRKLGKQLELYTFSDLVGAGLVLWTPNGTAICEALETFAKETEAKAGYVRVKTPHIAKETLYKVSGHLPYFKEDMFPPLKAEDEHGGELYYLKAMNCPHHHLIYKMRPRSYRELPLRLAEYGTCYRYESSGSLSGLVRVRALTMNDAHIYCSNDQIEEEIEATFKMAMNYYSMFRLKGVKIRLSTHDSTRKDKFVDNPKMWRYTEQITEQVIKKIGIEYEIGKGEAAFYGPKIDFQAKTVLGKEETISTTQLDFASPERFDLTYIGEDGETHRPFIIHRAPLSTHERFIGFLIEHFGGAFPTWLSPRQVVIIPVADKFLPYAQQISSALKEHLITAQIDTSDNSFNKKVRNAITSKIPNIAIVGEREMTNKTVTWRRYCVKEQKTLSLENFIKVIAEIKNNRIMDNFHDTPLPKFT